MVPLAITSRHGRQHQQRWSVPFPRKQGMRTEHVALKSWWSRRLVPATAGSSSIGLRTVWAYGRGMVNNICLTAHACQIVWNLVTSRSSRLFSPLLVISGSAVQFSIAGCLLPVPAGQRACSTEMYSSSLYHVWVRGNPCRRYKMMMMIVTEDGGSYPLGLNVVKLTVRRPHPPISIGDRCTILSSYLLLFFPNGKGSGQIWEKKICVKW
jgi:hypothetical protein